LEYKDIESRRESQEFKEEMKNNAGSDPGAINCG
jgi:hypothetical protein